MKKQIQSPAPITIFYDPDSADDIDDDDPDEDLDI
jgi:elongator complex protein 5